MSAEQTTDERLRQLGFGHRRDERSGTDSRRMIYSLADGAEIGRMNVQEANAFCKSLEDQRAAA